MLAILREIQEHRIEVERRLCWDKDEQRGVANWVKISSIATGAVILGLVLAGFLFPPFGAVTFLPSSLETTMLPVIAIPWPVVVWSVVGGWAAWLHRFNRNSREDFDDLKRWIFTRPLQGLLLGLAMYLVIRSGLMVLMPALTTGAGADGAQVGQNLPAFVVLVLCFLVAFSDRFGDRVFNVLVGQKLSPEPPSPPALSSEAP
jgi:hypothetical protein